MRRIAGAGLLVLFVAVAGSSQAAAAGSAKWTIQPTSSSKIGQARMTGLSCGGVTTCMAVGTERSKTFGFGELWNGTAWKPEVISEPSGVLLSDLEGVSCSSATTCTVVGDYRNTSGTYFTLAERWNGSHWAIQSTPTPGVNAAGFFGVSCPTSSDCTAVGSYQAVTGGPQVTLAEQWNGTTWTVETTPNPAASTFTQLSSVSCTSSIACIAVGYSEDGSGFQHLLAEGWNGLAWSIQSTPYPTGFTEGLFTGVSCTSSSTCTAAGNAYSNTQYVTVAERWNGLTWTVQSSPSGLAGEFEAVSCSTAAACTAVGQYQVVQGTFITLAEQWNGTTWTIKPIPTPKGRQGAQLTGVSCVSASVCEADGYSFAATAMSYTLAEGNDT